MRLGIVYFAQAAMKRRAARLELPEKVPPLVLKLAIGA
jgi:hypothetical protein